MKIKESNITINVSNLDKAVSFYESIGFALKNRWSEHYAQLTAPGLTIGLHPSGKDKIAGNSGNVSIDFTTETFEETKSELQNLSIKFSERQESGGEFLHFTDPA